MSSDLTLLKGVYIYIHMLYIRLLVSVTGGSGCWMWTVTSVWLNISLWPKQLDLPILNMTKAPVAHGHSLGTDWPTCMISTNTEDTVDGNEIWKKIRLTTWDGAKTLVKKWDFNYRSLIWWNRRISEPSTVAPRFCGTTSTVWILPRNLTWNLKITHWKRKTHWHLPNHHFWVPC